MGQTLLSQYQKTTTKAMWILDNQCQTYLYCDPNLKCFHDMHSPAIDQFYWLIGGGGGGGKSQHKFNISCQTTFLRGGKLV